MLGWGQIPEQGVFRSIEIIIYAFCDIFDLLHHIGVLTTVRIELLVTHQLAIVDNTQQVTLNGALAVSGPVPREEQFTDGHIHFEIDTVALTVLSAHSGEPLIIVLDAL